MILHVICKIFYVLYQTRSDLTFFLGKNPSKSENFFWQEYEVFGKYCQT